jgi:hypothetical protein
MCALRATDPLRVEALENRLALGESRVAIAKEFGIDRHRVLRHWQHHCDQKEILRRVHRQREKRVILTRTPLRIRLP